MGYTTEFKGSFTVTPPLNPAQVAYINKFRETRRMKRDAKITAARPDPIREAVGLPVGIEGGYFVGAGGDCGQEDGGWDENRNATMKALGILDDNDPPAGQPGLWCQWEASEDGTEIKWDEGEKFYNYVEWLQYLVDHFLEPWGCAINGSVAWRGEDFDDIGTIVVHDNKITTTAEMLSQ